MLSGFCHKEAKPCSRTSHFHLCLLWGGGCSWKESCQGVMVNKPHQYQQNEQLSLTLTHWTQNKITTYDIGITGPGLRYAQNVAGLNRLMGSQTFLSDNWIRSPIIFPLPLPLKKKHYTITKMKDSINMDSTKTESCNGCLYLADHYKLGR